MISKQDFYGCLAHASYLMADEDSRSQRWSIHHGISSSTLPREYLLDCFARPVAQWVPGHATVRPIDRSDRISTQCALSTIAQANTMQLKRSPRTGLFRFSESQHSQRIVQDR